MNEPSAPLPHDRPAWAARFFSQVHRYQILLIRRWWVLPLCIAVALAGEDTRLRTSPPSFVSVGQMIVSIKLNIQQGSLYSEELGNFLGTQAALMQGSEVLNRARDRVASLHPELRPQPVHVDVSILPKTTIFILRASGPDPEIHPGLSPGLHGGIHQSQTARWWNTLPAPPSPD